MKKERKRGTSAHDFDDDDGGDGSDMFTLSPVCLTA